MLCEGETEEAYFEGLRRHLRQQRPDDGRGIHSPEPKVDTAERTAARKMAQQARALVSQGYSEIWVVFDTEGANVTQTRNELAEAGKGQSDTSLLSAVSHPSFEVWLLLHHVERGRLSGCHEAEDSYRLLKKTVPTWDKGFRNRRDKPGTDFGDFVDGLDRACRQAAKTRADDYGDYPWTDVHLLVDRLREHYA
ncbi:RloB domain-containing protein [Nocardiopsis sp. HNM0947]|uniref:RloB domain-containing protein n=1 Tax=Nocardiopsis coralli TaxID=2772213 RepID=A0ABR9P4U2_9ACTN|nr:RloB family protein [Nocardiopsis coralli]MBE2998866.1 RloB domain-containing protein [Nocardiopsis coralli]